MRNMNESEVKSNLIRCLHDVVTFCKDNNISYMITAGTLLGAVRHKGLIPWDNDIDIMMPVEDYFKFQKLTSQKLISEYVYVSYFQGNANHYWPMTKVFLLDTYLREQKVLDKYADKVSNYSGIYVDVFPAYGLPENFEERKKFCSKLNRLWEKWRYSVKTFTANSSLEYLIKLWHAIPCRISGPRRYIQQMEMMIKKYDLNSATYFACSLGSVPEMKDVNESNEILRNIVLTFEGIECLAPANYHKMLTQYYGDYMKIPPVSERISHTVKILWRN